MGEAEEVAELVGDQAAAAREVVLLVAEATTEAGLSVQEDHPPTDSGFFGDEHGLARHAVGPVAGPAVLEVEDVVEEVVGVVRASGIGKATRGPDSAAEQG